MKKLIFIDTNRYLNFYNSKDSEYKRLLGLLVDYKEYIFVPKQIVDEVYRNKLRLFINSFVQYMKQIAMENISLPEHLESGEEVAIKAWNKQNEEIKEKAKKHTEDLTKLTESLIGKIRNDKDEVSIILSKLFKEMEAPTEDQKKKARDRKDFGNPPGKRTDPIGDQLSWEQLLDKVEGLDELWVVTFDQDYFTSFNRKLYLNPLLEKEIRDKNDDIKIRCYETLSEALKDFSSENTKPKQKVITKTDWSKIIYDEKQSNWFDYKYSSLYSPTSNILNNNLILSGNSSNMFTTYPTSSLINTITSPVITEFNPFVGTTMQTPILPVASSYSGMNVGVCPYCHIGNLEVLTNPNTMPESKTLKCRNCGHEFK